MEITPPWWVFHKKKCRKSIGRVLSEEFPSKVSTVKKRNRSDRNWTTRRQDGQTQDSSMRW